MARRTKSIWHHPLVGWVVISLTAVFVLAGLGVLLSYPNYVNSVNYPLVLFMIGSFFAGVSILLVWAGWVQYKQMKMQEEKIRFTQWLVVLLMVVMGVLLFVFPTLQYYRSMFDKPTIITGDCILAVEHNRKSPTEYNVIVNEVEYDVGKDDWAMLTTVDEYSCKPTCACKHRVRLTILPTQKLVLDLALESVRR